MFAARPNARRGSEKRASSSPGAHRAPAGPPRDAPSSCSRVAPFRRHLRPPCAQRQRLHHVGLRGRQAHQHDRPADVAIGHVEHVGQRFDQPRALAGPTPLTTSVSPSPRSRASNLPRTLSAGVPYDMPSSTPRHASAIRLTSSNVTAPPGALPRNRVRPPYPKIAPRARSPVCSRGARRRSGARRRPRRTRSRTHAPADECRPALPALRPRKARTTAKPPDRRCAARRARDDGDAARELPAAQAHGCPCADRVAMKPRARPLSGEGSRVKTNRAIAGRPTRFAPSPAYRAPVSHRNGRARSADRISAISRGESASTASSPRHAAVR